MGVAEKETRERPAATAACPACRQPAAPCGVELGGYPLYLCSRCGLRFAPTAFQVPVNYDDLYAGGLYPDQTQEAMRKSEAEGFDAAKWDTYMPFFRWLRPSAGRDRLLDVGCGAGRFCRGAARHGWNTLGIDVSDVALHFAREMGQSGQTGFPGSLAYRAIDLGAVPEAYGQFDSMTAFEVLEHQSDLRGLLAKARRALKPDGRFLCTVPNWEHPDVQSAVRQDWVPPVHLLFFTRAALGAALTSNGFQVLRCDYVPGPPPVPWLKAKWKGKVFAKKLLGRSVHFLGLWALAKPAS